MQQAAQTPCHPWNGVDRPCSQVPLMCLTDKQRADALNEVAVMQELVMGAAIKRAAGPRGGSTATPPVAFRSWDRGTDAAARP